MKCMIHVIKFICWLFLAIVVGACDIVYILSGKWILVVIFSGLFVWYFYLAFFQSGIVMSIDECGVHRNILGIFKSSMKWSEIEEMGVIGVGALRNAEFKKLGTRYIYFSREKMSDEERFDLCIQWPPKDKFYIVYNSKRFEYILEKCSLTPRYYNVGDLMIG